MAFERRNSDHFRNIHSAQLDTAGTAQIDHVDGLRGQTADAAWKADSNSQAWVQHVEHDTELPAGEGELGSTAYKHNRYLAQSRAS